MKLQPIVNPHSRVG
jgi:tetratricopeptide (TPR) repeat protein